MGKIFVLSVTDHEEYILSRIMEIIAAWIVNAGTERGESDKLQF